MQKITLWFILVLTLALTACNLQSQETAALAAPVKDTCPVTQPPDSRFVPPDPYPESPHASMFWYGSEALWTAVPVIGEWAALPHSAEGYTQKLFWWHEGYSWEKEPVPQLSVTGRRLDAPAPPLTASTGTHALAEDIHSAMLMGVGFPTAGCWEITGRYEGHELSFVILITP
jgi:hypothetical protein